MKKQKLLGLLLIGFIVNGCCAELLVDKIKFASVEKAKELLTQEDSFTRSWSQFDIDSRMQKKQSTKEDLFDLITKQVREWTTDEKSQVISTYKEIEKQIVDQGFKIDYPDEIYIVKTTAEEEGGAGGYTRANYIVLNENSFTDPNSDLKHFFTHELFHVLTRNNPKFRKEMYQIFGFNLMNNVEYPEDLKAYRITNPDAPQIDSYISLTVDGEIKNCMMILYSNRDYDGGHFFNYLNIGFLSLTGDSIKTIEYKDDKPIIYPYNQVTGFFEQVGQNTQYIIHPEEIAADNFAHAILNKKDLTNPEIITKIKKILHK